MILYIHGFNSSGFGAKAEMLRAHFKEDILAPSLSNIPTLAMDTLEQIINLCQRQGVSLSLMGSSLGGYYAIYLADKYALKAVLINPSIYPYVTLANYIGENPSFFDLSNREWTQKHVETLKSFEVKAPKQENFLLLLQSGDETLDYRHAVEKFPDAKIDLEEGGSHGFDGFERKISEIEAFLSL